VWVLLVYYCLISQWFYLLLSGIYSRFKVFPFFMFSDLPSLSSVPNVLYCHWLATEVLDSLCVSKCYSHM
jgi:hypothetical protein